MLKKSGQENFTAFALKLKNIPFNLLASNYGF
jgi:hypothetical protein